MCKYNTLLLFDLEIYKTNKGLSVKKDLSIIFAIQLDLNFI